MARTFLLSGLVLVLASLTAQAVVLQQKRAPPTLKLGSATLTGSYGLFGAEAFRSIPYALPPTGQRRFLAPVKAPALTGDFDASRNPQACRQFLSQAANVTNAPSPTSDAFTAFFNGPLYNNFADTLGRILGLSGQKALDTSEDCLNLNVVRPAVTKAGDKLPIVVWIYGGAFAAGEISLYEPAALIKRSIDMKQPIIHVAMNYRVGVYGFSSFTTTNAGLLDQRLALEWIQENADAFGGDRTKVTLWGESAGAISIGMHLVSEGTTSTNLFRAAISESGSPYRTIRSEDAQAGDNIVARFTGCDRAPEGVLKCLQSKSTREIDAAAQQVPGLNTWSGIKVFFAPVVDGPGGYIPDYPDKLLRAGRFKRDVALLNGDQDDEGTVLVRGAVANLTTDAHFEKWVKEVLNPGITDAQYQEVARLYPSTPSEGSPYGTGNANQAIGSRLTDDMQSRWISFINSLTPDADPNAVKWPSYGTQRKLLVFDEMSTRVEEDNQRDTQMAYLEKIFNA